ncbi:FUSC family protein [Phytoactinopolyspora halophila]|uniref:FUSC family protein n=1 Tax=Phytoactinopolyspora halophila TaxID=1981511 RepID=UPI001314ECF0|nr:FUSC family protein [Phytoactinopolyspora halophila]
MGRRHAPKELFSRFARVLASPAGRLREAGTTLVQAAAAAGASWFLAHEVLGHRPGIFAPIGAMLVLSLAPGRRVRRAVEIVAGAAVGVVIGDLLIAVIGTGPVQVFAVATLAMGAATALGAPPMLVTQAGVASVLIATIEPPDGLYSSLANQRLIDVLIGGGVGLVASFTLPRHPLASTRAAATPLFAELRGTLEQIAVALETGAVTEADAVLERSRTLDGYVHAWQEAIDQAEETAFLSPPHRRKRSHVGRQAAALGPVELAVRDVRVLARGVVRVCSMEKRISPELALAVRDLAAAVLGLETELDGGEGGARARADAVRAAGRASLLVSDQASMPTSAVVAQVRSTATDLLRALGLDVADAVAQVRTAAQQMQEHPNDEKGDR